MFPPTLELGTFRVCGERDNHYTTKTTTYLAARTFYLHRAKMPLVSIYITKDIHGTRRPTYKDAAILLTRLCDKMVKCKCKCIQSFVERHLQDDQRPFTCVPGNTSYMQNTVSL